MLPCSLFHSFSFTNPFFPPRLSSYALALLYNGYFTFRYAVSPSSRRHWRNDVLRHGFEVFFKLCPAIPKGAGKFRRNLFADLKRKVVRFQSGRCSFVYWYRRFLSLPVLLSIPRYKPVGCSISRSARRRGGHQPHARRSRSCKARCCSRGRNRLPRQRLAASTNNYG